MAGRAPGATGRIAFAFPGVGVRLCGREEGLFAANRPIFEPLFGEASEACGADLARALCEGAADRLPDQVQQYFTYAFSAGVDRLWRSRGVLPEMTAGFSFGIYAALFSAGAVSFSDGIRMLGEAFRLMRRESAGQGCGVGLVVGLRRPEIDQLLVGAGGSVAMTNESNDTCHVFSGRKDDLAALMDRALAQDAFSAEILDVDIPYHHPRLLGGASAAFRKYIASLDWRVPACPVVSSIDQTILSDVDSLVAFTSANLTTPISWKKVAEALHRAGVVRIFECGPGVSLTQSGRFMAFEIEYVNIKKANRWRTPR